MVEEKLWLKKAEEDFNTAEFNKEHQKYSYAAFLYQQAIEKGLKAILIKKKKGLHKTHDCFVLAKQADAPAEIVKKADTATPYYGRTRYPDAILIDITKEEIDMLAEVAREALAWIKKNC